MMTKFIVCSTVLTTSIFNSFPLSLACTAFPGSHSYHPQTPSSIPLLPPSTGLWPPANTMCLAISSYCAHKTMTLHTMTPPTMFTNNFCACQSFPFTNIRLICSLLDEFRTSFFQDLTCFNGCVAAIDA